MYNLITNLSVKLTAIGEVIVANILYELGFSIGVSLISGQVLLLDIFK